LIGHAYVHDGNRTLSSDAEIDANCSSCHSVSSFFLEALNPDKFSSIVRDISKVQEKDLSKSHCIGGENNVLDESVLIENRTQNNGNDVFTKKRSSVTIDRDPHTKSKFGETTNKLSSTSKDCSRSSHSSRTSRDQRIKSKSREARKPSTKSNESSHSTQSSNRSQSRASLRNMSFQRKPENAESIWNSKRYFHIYDNDSDESRLPLYQTQYKTKEQFQYGVESFRSQRQHNTIDKNTDLKSTTSREPHWHERRQVRQNTKWRHFDRHQENPNRDSRKESGNIPPNLMDVDVSNQSRHTSTSAESGSNSLRKRHRESSPERIHFKRQRLSSNDREPSYHPMHPNGYRYPDAACLEDGHRDVNTRHDRDSHYQRHSNDRYNDIFN